MASLIARATAWRRILPASLLAASATLGSSTLGELPTARATWDMDEFYACWDATPKPPKTTFTLAPVAPVG